MSKMLTPHLSPLPSPKGEAKTQAPPNQSDRTVARQNAIGTPRPATRGEATVRGALQDDSQIIRIEIGQTAEIMQRAWAGIVASGSATLEAAYFRLPFVLIYKVAWPTYLAARLVVNVKYLGMPNLLADKEVAPEFIQHRERPGVIAKHVYSLINDTTAAEPMIHELDRIIAKSGAAG